MILCSCNHTENQCQAGYVYVATVGDLHKIGYTKNPVHLRMFGISRERKTRALPLFAIKTVCAIGLESALHRAFWPKRVIRLIDRTDYFSLEPDDVDSIRHLVTFNTLPVEVISVDFCAKPYVPRVSASMRRVAGRSKRRLIVMKGVCGHELKVIADCFRVGSFTMTLLFEHARLKGIHCDSCSDSIIPVSVIRTEAWNQ